MLTYLPEPKVIEEAHRVLRPGGMLLLEFTQMVPLHDEPWDFYRFTRYGAEHLLRAAASSRSSTSRSAASGRGSGCPRSRP